MANEKEIRGLVRRLLDQALTTDGLKAGSEAGVRDLAGKIVQSKIAIGADHGGWGLKEKLVEHLRSKGHGIDDCGTHGKDSVDYPDFAHAVATKVAAGTCHWGIVIDGAGIGSAMVANKVPGVRAALCYDLSTAKNSREHNHANVLTLGAGLIGEGLARQIVDTWLATPWGPGRHARRADMITEVEQLYLKGRAGEHPESERKRDG